MAAKKTGKVGAPAVGKIELDPKVTAMRLDCVKLAITLAGPRAPRGDDDPLETLTANARRIEEYIGTGRTSKRVSG